VIIFRGADGRALTMDDLRGLSGTFRYEIMGHSNVPTEAQSIHKLARHAGQSGDYKTAITLLQQARSLSPQWPYPPYDMAFTYLMMTDRESARAYYRKTVELSPRGFFEAITAAAALEREQKGDLPSGTYLKYLSLEWTADAGKKKDIVHQLVTGAPGFAPGWKELATLLNDDDEQLVAIERGLTANPDRDTRGVLLINKALILHRKGDRGGAIHMLVEVALDPASTYATEHMAKISLANLIQN
jgi:tetratricopeptide (TPR) repeat protein